MLAPDITEPRIVVLVSGSGTNLHALIRATRDRGFPGKIVAVGSNCPDAYALERARQAGLETFTVDHKAHDSRDAFDTVLKANIERFSPDVLVLAGFMRILTPAFVRAFQGIILNTHPSLLPKYTGLNTHQRALDAGDAQHGVSIHFVTEDLDGGPVVAQAEITIDGADTPDTLADKVQHKEHLLYPIVVRWFCEGRLKLVADNAYFDGVPLNAPMRLSAAD